MPTSKITPAENIANFFAPLEWHPDLARDLKECQECIDEGRKRSALFLRDAADMWDRLVPFKKGSGMSMQYVMGMIEHKSNDAASQTLTAIFPDAPDEDRQSFAALARAHPQRDLEATGAAINYISKRYKTIWERFPDVSRHLWLMLYRAMITGEWKAEYALSIVAPQANEVLYEVFQDFRDVRPLVYPDRTNFMPQLKRVSLFPEERSHSQLWAAPERVSWTPHPAIVIHPMRYASRDDMIKALDEAANIAGILDYPGVKSQGTPPKIAKDVAVYRMWWEYERACKGQNVPASKRAFYERLAYKDVLSLTLLEELKEGLAEWEASPPTTRRSSLKNVAWLKPDNNTPPLGAFLDAAVGLTNP